MSHCIQCIQASMAESQLTLKCAYKEYSFKQCNTQIMSDGALTQNVAIFRQSIHWFHTAGISVVYNYMKYSLVLDQGTPI